MPVDNNESMMMGSSSPMFIVTLDGTINSDELGTRRGSGDQILARTPTTRQVIGKESCKGDSGGLLLERDDN